MQAEGYRRARKLLTSRGDYVAARVLGFVQSLLLVVLLGIIAIFVATLASRGEARFPSSAVDRLPAVGNQPDDRRGRAAVCMFKDTGVFPLIARSLRPNNVVDRFAAQALLGLTRVLAQLAQQHGRTRDAAGLGLACIILIALVAIWRRNVIGAGRDARLRRRCDGRFIARCTGWASRRCRRRGLGRSSTCGRGRSTTFATACWPTWMPLRGCTFWRGAC